MDAAVAVLLTKTKKTDDTERPQEKDEDRVKNFGAIDVRFEKETIVNIKKSKKKAKKIRKTDENINDYGNNQNRYFIDKKCVLHQRVIVDPIYYQKPFPEHFSESNDDKRFGSAFDILDQMCPNVEKPQVNPWDGFPGTTMDKLLEDAKNHSREVPLKDQYFDQIREVLRFLYVAENNNSIKNSYKTHQLDKNTKLERDSLSLVLDDSASTSSTPIYKYRTYLEPLLRPVIIDSAAFHYSIENIAQVLIHFISSGHYCIALFPENHQPKEKEQFETLRIFKLIQFPIDNEELCWKEKVQSFAKNVEGVLVDKDCLGMSKIIRNNNEPTENLCSDEEQSTEMSYNEPKFYPSKCIDLATMISQQLYLAEQSMFLSILLRCGFYSTLILSRIKSMFYLINTRSPNPSDILWKGFDISNFPFWSTTQPTQFWSNESAPKNRIIQKNWKMEAELVDDF